MSHSAGKIGWVVAALVALVLLQCMGIWIPGVDVLFFLLAGWIPFLQRVIPRLSVRWDLVASAAVYVAFLVVGSHLLFRWLYREMRRPAADAAMPTGWPWRWTFRLVTLVLVLFAAGTAIVGMAHQTTWLVRSPETLYRRGGERSHRIKCASNLRQIGQAIHLYSADHNGKFPDDFAVLLAHGNLTPDVFICPSSDDEAIGHVAGTQPVANLPAPGHCSFVYLGRGVNNTTGSSTVVAVEPLENHDGDGINVLYGDGHTDWLDGPEAERLLVSLGFERVPAPLNSR